MSNYRINPARFYKIADLIEESQKLKSDKQQELNDSVAKQKQALDEKRLALTNALQTIHQEIRSATKRNPLAPIEDLEQDLNRFQHTLSGQTFLGVVHNSISYLHSAYSVLDSIIIDLTPEPLVLSGTKFNIADFDLDNLQRFKAELDINEVTISRYISALTGIKNGPEVLLDRAKAIFQNIESYYLRLMRRHADGIKIHRDPIATDIALSIFENIDAHGEIESGTDPNEISAYSLNKAESIILGFKKVGAQEFINEPDKFITFITSQLSQLWETVQAIKTLHEKSIKQINDLFEPRRYDFVTTDHRIQEEFEYTLRLMGDVNPQSVKETEKKGLLSTEEKASLKFKNETISVIVKYLLSQDFNPSAIVQYVLQRKAELRRYYQEENSFYVCRIGAGNVFSGEAPGALSIVPGTKPNINLDDIIGSGFTEVRDFVRTIEMSAKWHDIFVATSPSKTADKANMLLIGPAGCGKTEVMRAVATDRGSIAVFAQGSDFMTCWKGEAEKNPKRLFEGAIKIQKESKRHVHILIDEIDSVLKKQSETAHGDFNLTLEFQILMDGVVEYPGISVIGATNCPERIPLPMIRRFSKVLIVGELDNNDRKGLLKHFSSYLPVDYEFPEHAWDDLANKLEGATGDVIRKIVDYVWRFKISNFTASNPTEAAKLIDSLNQEEKFDVKEFDAKRRQSFKNELRKYVKVTPDDLNKSIDIHLKNIAITSEIQEAKSVYYNAHSWLTDIDGSALEKVSINNKSTDDEWHWKRSDAK